jgi:redox-sensing transcriptional repressor
MSYLSDSGEAERPRIPEATVARLAVYEHALSLLSPAIQAMSSDELAAAAGVNSTTLRKDLSYVGNYGTRGVGYEVAMLAGRLREILGSSEAHRVALIGIGNLGVALANYSGFLSRGLVIAALFDVDTRKIGQRVGALVVENVSDMTAVCERERISIGVIATPAHAAQEAADALVAAGVRAILAFAPGVLQLPAGIELRKVDLALELQVLAYRAPRRGSSQQHVTDIAGATDAAGVLGETGKDASVSFPDSPLESAKPAPEFEGSDSSLRPSELTSPWPSVDGRRTASPVLSRSAR